MQYTPRMRKGQASPNVAKSHKTSTSVEAIRGLSIFWRAGAEKRVLAAVAPTKVATAMPRLATTTAARRLRVTPWNDAKPAGSAPRAAKAPESRWPRWAAARHEGAGGLALDPEGCCTRPTRRTCRGFPGPEP